MHALSRTFLMCLLTVAILALPAMGIHFVTLTPESRHQTIDGWGAALYGSTSAQQVYADSRFRQAWADAGLNIIRVPMVKEVLVHSSQDYATPVELGTNLQTNVDRMNFNLGVLNSYGGFAQWLSQNAMEPDRVKVHGAVWTPPHWMKGPTGNTQNFVGITDNYATPWLSGMHNPYVNPPRPTGDSIGGRLKTEDAWTLQQYGRYMAAWVTGFEQKFGVPVYSMSVQNESTFENPFDSMVLHLNRFGNVDYSEFAKALKAIEQAWTQYGIATKVMGPGVAGVGPTPSNPHLLNHQMRMIQGIKQHADPTLIDFLDYYCSNYYMGTSLASVQATAGYYLGRQNVSASWAHWLYAPGVQQDNKPIWYDETGGSVGTWLAGSGGTPGNGAINVALKMHNALVHSNAAAYIHWQFADGGSNVTEHTLIGSSHLNNPSLSKKYNAFSHFSRFIRPGAHRIDAVFDNGRTSVGAANTLDTFNSLNVSAYVHDEDRTLTLVLVNMLGTSQEMFIPVPELDFVIPHFDAYRTDSMANFLHMGQAGMFQGALYVNIPAYSVLTLYGQGLASLLLPGDANGDGRGQHR